MNARQLALGGITAGLALVILCFGGVIPVATYILPMILCILLQMIFPSLGSKGGWVWYIAVSILAVMLCPDKEAASVWVFLGWYPLLKPKIEGLKGALCVKLLLFNAATLLMYSLLIHLFGMSVIGEEFQTLGVWLTLLTLALGNLCFFLLDRVLSRFSKRKPGA